MAWTTTQAICDTLRKFLHNVSRVLYLGGTWEHQTPISDVVFLAIFLYKLCCSGDSTKTTYSVLYHPPVQDSNLVPLWHEQHICFAHFEYKLRNDQWDIIQNIHQGKFPKMKGSLSIQPLLPWKVNNLQDSLLFCYSFTEEKWVIYFFL